MKSIVRSMYRVTMTSTDKPQKVSHVLCSLAIINCHMHDNLDTDMLNATKHCNANSLIAYVHIFNVLARCCRARPIDHLATSVWILKVTLFVLSFELKKTNKQKLAVDQECPQNTLLNLPCSLNILLNISFLFLVKPRHFILFCNFSLCSVHYFLKLLFKCY